MTRPNISLAKLLEPLAMNDFLTTYWPATLFVNHQAGLAANHIGTLPGLESVTTLLRTYRGAVSCLHPDREALERRNSSDAIQDYLDGYTCYLRDVQDYIKELRPIVSDISKHTQVPVEYVTCEMFCSSSDSGVAMHSDYDINFALLVRGEKHWRIAKNEHLVNQPGVCLAGAYQPHCIVRQLTEDLLMPTAMPPTTTAVTATAGTLLFLPRGWWHQTAARGECLQINFVVKGPQLSELVTRALESHLMRDTSWREFAHGIGGPGEHKHTAEVTERLTQLIGKLRAELAHTPDRQLAIEILRRAATGFPI